MQVCFGCTAATVLSPDVKELLAVLLSATAAHTPFTRPRPSEMMSPGDVIRRPLQACWRDVTLASAAAAASSALEDESRRNLTNSNNLTRDERRCFWPHARFVMGSLDRFMRWDCSQ